MIAGHKAERICRAEFTEPFRRALEFPLQAEIDDIPRHRNMIRLMREDIGAKSIRDFHLMHPAPPPHPVQRAEAPLAEEFPEPEPAMERQMGICEMRYGISGHEISPGQNQLAGAEINR